MIILQENRAKIDFSLKHWIIAFIVIEIVWTLGGSLLTYYANQIAVSLNWSNFVIVGYINQHLNLILLFLLLLYFIKRILRVELIRYLTDSSKFRWSLFFNSFLIWFGVITISAFLLFIFKRDLFVFQKAPFRFLFIAAALCLTPLQAFSEELLFRTTIWRMLEDRVSNKRIISFFGALLFSLAHLFNKELFYYDQKYFILAYYFMSGFLFMEITIRSRGTESTLGAHIANNLFIAIFLNYTSSSLISESFFIQKYPIIEIDFLILFICSALILRLSKDSEIASFD
jgi:membrane protease YdiL (CAAX protease family)